MTSPKVTGDVLPVFRCCSQSLLFSKGMLSKLSPVEAELMASQTQFGYFRGDLPAIMRSHLKPQLPMSEQDAKQSSLDGITKEPKVPWQLPMGMWNDSH